MVFNDITGKENSVGKPAQNVQIKIVNEMDDPKKNGEICLISLSLDTPAEK